MGMNNVERELRRSWASRPITHKPNDNEYRWRFEQEYLAFAATELITTMMKEQGLKKADLAKKIGKSKAFVSQVLAGSRNMTMHTFADLAFALGHRVDLNVAPLTMTQGPCA